MQEREKPLLDAIDYQKAKAEIANAQRFMQPSLNFAGYRLTELPPEIGNLVGLKSLDLSINRLTALPPEIGNLVGLETLNITYNRLTALPPEIGNLVKLKELYIRGNKLTELPPEIDNLIGLEKSENFNADSGQPYIQLLKLATRNMRTTMATRATSNMPEKKKPAAAIMHNRKDSLKSYMNSYRYVDYTPDQKEPEVILLDFEVLPAGFYDEPEYQQTQRNKSGRDSHVAQIDRERLRFIESLGPNAAYRGSSQFGPDVYHVFVFSNCVVAECPTEGNAIYVLKGVANWKTLLSIPKLELRQDYANRVQRIMHRGEWKDRLRKAVR